MLLGIQEYASGDYGAPESNTPLFKVAPNDKTSGYKIGAYEPASAYHADVEFIHVVDIDNGTYRSVAIPRDVMGVMEYEPFQKAMRDYVQRTLVELRNGTPSEYERTPENEYPEDDD